MIIDLLEMLIKENPTAFVELVRACRDPNFQLTGSIGSILVDRGLVQHIDANKHARIHDVTRSVVLSATSGVGTKLAFGSPLAD